MKAFLASSMDDRKTFLPILYTVGGRRRGRTKSATSPLFSEEKRHDISEQNQLQQSYMTRAGIKGSVCTEIQGKNANLVGF